MDRAWVHRIVPHRGPATGLAASAATQMSTVMEPSTINPRGLVLAGLLGLLAAREAVSQPGLRGRGEEILAVLTLQDGPATLGALGRALGPVPVGLPLEIRTGMGLAWLGLRARLGRTHDELVNLIVPGPAVLAVVVRDGRQVPLFTSRVLEPAAVSSLLEDFPDIPGVLHGEVLAVGPEARALDFLLPALSDPGAEPGLRIHVDLQSLRALGGIGAGSISRGLDGGSRFLFGPWVRIWERAGALDGEVLATELGVELRVRLDATIAGDPWQELSARGDAPRLAPAPPVGTVAFVSLDRQLLGLFGNLSQMLSEEDVASAQSFLSGVEQIMGGASFVEDVLGSLAEPMHVYVLDSQEHLPPGEQPRIRLPSFALVAELRDASRTTLKNILERAARFLLLVTNAQRAMDGQAPFRLRRETGDGFAGLVAEPMEWRGPGSPPTEHGLSPTLLFAHGHVVLASTRGGAMSILESLSRRRTVQLVGDHLEVRGPALARVLRRNQSVLQMGRVLDEGETLAESKRFWQTVNAVLDAFPSIRLEVRSDGSETHATLSVRRR